MRSQSVDFITSNEQHVRLRIFDGDLQISDAAAELIRIERAQRVEAERVAADLRAKLSGRGK